MKTMKLPCKLTDSELLERGAELARVVAEAEALDSRLRVARAESKTAVKRARVQAKDLAGAISSRSEQRDVQVDDVPDHATGMVYTVRADTGERVGERPMTAEDRQLSLVPPAAVLPFGGPTKPAGNDGPPLPHIHDELPSCDCGHPPEMHADSDVPRHGWTWCGADGCHCRGTQTLGAVPQTEADAF